MFNLISLRQELRKAADPEKAKGLARFFKTGKGQYGEHNLFLGISVPDSRKLAIKYNELSFDEIRELLKSKVHEERLIALLILVHNFRLGSDPKRKAIFEYYLANTKYINNWDLVDLSADKIVGEYLVLGTKEQSNKGLKVIKGLARSKSMWERRIAIIATYAFIKRGESKLTFEISKKLIDDRRDLIQKAVGWMLREVGKRCGQETEEQFLVRHYKQMGRTCLRYAIEHFSRELRKKYLLGQI